MVAHSLASCVPVKLHMRTRTHARVVRAVPSLGQRMWIIVGIQDAICIHVCITLAQRKGHATGIKTQHHVYIRMANVNDEPPSLAPRPSWLTPQHTPSDRSSLQIISAWPIRGRPRYPRALTEPPTAVHPHRRAGALHDKISWGSRPGLPGWCDHPATIGPAVRKTTRWSGGSRAAAGHGPPVQ